MILYLTYNDQPSGVYWSQVTGVVAHLNSLGGPRVRLLALVSARDYPGIRRKIRAHSADALVLPMVPKMKYWRKNAFIVKRVCQWLRPTGIIARGPLGTWMALRARERGLVQRVCFDARGAYAAEWEEYRIIDDDALIAQFRPAEKEAIHGSDFRLAVSNALVDHWREQYGYAGNAHVVIPCTLAAAHVQPVEPAGNARAMLGFGPADVVLVYSGSTAGWQSFGMLEELLAGVLAAQPYVKVLFLCPPDAVIDSFAARWKGRAVRTWVGPAQVPHVLNACDMALLVREDTLTNRVASPTKFAEYLASGLPVLISPCIGDFSEAVARHGLGTVLLHGQAPPMLERPTDADRARFRAFAMAHYTKAAHDEAYRSLLDRMAGAQ